MHCNTLKQDNDSTVRGDGGSRVGEVPEHKGFKLQQLSRDPLTPADGPGRVSVNSERLQEFVIEKQKRAEREAERQKEESEAEGSSIYSERK